LGPFVALALDAVEALREAFFIAWEAKAEGKCKTQEGFRKDELGIYSFFAFKKKQRLVHRKSFTYLFNISVIVHDF
jgi:hypothetical protein